MGTADNSEKRGITSDHFRLMESWLHKEHIKPWYQEPEEWIKEIQNR
jgi:hypothetical protein